MSADALTQDNSQKPKESTVFCLVALKEDDIKIHHRSMMEKSSRKYSLPL